jgi:spoIIIJ-associated protein
MAAEQDYPEAPPTERDAEAEEMIAKLLDFFLASMGVVAETFVRDELDSGSLVFEIEGPDAGLLIGRRGETLQALQFAVRMVTNRQLGRKCYVIIDVEGYRERRSEMLQRLARRTAGRVATMGRPASLEPMTPAERRIIHMTLADHPRVRTESEGEGNRRRVVVMPKRAGGGRPGRDDGEGQVQGAPDERGGFRGRRMRRPYNRRGPGAPQGGPGQPDQPMAPDSGGPDGPPAPDGDQRPPEIDAPAAQADGESPGEAR